VAAQLESSANELEQWLQEAEQGLARMDSERGDRQHSQHQVRIHFLAKQLHTIILKVKFAFIIFDHAKTCLPSLNFASMSSLNTLEVTLKINFLH
jgi:hypothetical protein